MIQSSSCHQISGQLIFSKLQRMKTLEINASRITKKCAHDNTKCANKLLNWMSGALNQCKFKIEIYV